MVISAPNHVGKYEILGQLGKGGMGAVYLAYDPLIQRTVALKVISRSALDHGDSEPILERFKREAQAAGRLVHPNIVSIYEYGEDQDYAFIAMEYVRGDPLHHRLTGGRRLPLEQIRSVLYQLLKALAFSHRHGVVHRDIKPSNILINEDGQVKVTDFGIARIDSSTMTQLGDVLGTPNYMSPEQFQGKVVDARSDIYSAGVLAFQLLGGQRPYPGSGFAVMKSVLEDPIPSMLSHNAELSPVIDSVVRKALAKSADDRYQSAEEFGDALVAALGKPSREGRGEGEAEPEPEAQAPAGPRINRHALASLRKGGGPCDEADEPVVPHEPDETPSIAFDAVRGARSRILFVDDEERILSALRALFRRRYHVFTATDGNQALEFAQRFHMHLVASDQRMPEMAGVDLLRRIREISPHTVRILLTGYSDLAAMVGSINDGEVYRFISKPWNDRELKEIIEEAVAIGAELAESGVVQPVPEGRPRGTILVLSADHVLERQVRGLLVGGGQVVHARDIPSAIVSLQTQEVAVILADLDTGSEHNVTFIKLLKQEYPQILTIVVTQASDSELVIELINQAQIYRFINKPINLKMLKQHLATALARYAAFEKAPYLLKAHRVDEQTMVRRSSLGQGILSGLKSLGGRLTSVLR